MAIGPNYDTPKIWDKSRGTTLGCSIALLNYVKRVMMEGCADGWASVLVVILHITSFETD